MHLLSTICLVCVALALGASCAEDTTISSSISSATTEKMGSTATDVTSTAATTITKEVTTTESLPSSTTSSTSSSSQSSTTESSKTTELTFTTSTTEMTTTTRDPVRNWNHVDLEKEFETKVKDCAAEPPRDEPLGPCPQEWHRYKESCYLIKKKRTTVDEADKICQKYNTTLFVADNRDELDFISSKAVPHKAGTWIGVFQKDEESAKWQSDCGMDTEALPWLVGIENHGWNKNTRCAYLVTNTPTPYAHFNPCDVKKNFICERNATLYI